jgi:hypothetical protein
MADAKLRQGTADLRTYRLRNRLAGLGRVEIMAAAVGVELAEQTVLLDHLTERTKARPRALLRDDKA